MSTNIFPASATITWPNGDDQTQPKVRVRTNPQENRLQLWISARQYPHEPICLIDQPIAETTKAYNQWGPARDRIGHWVLEDGTVLQVKATGGCGCGDKLRNLPSWTATSQQVVGV